MIKRILLLFAFSALYGGENLYLLPDQNNELVHRLQNALRGTSAKVVIITPSFRHALLKKALLQGAKHGNRITLVVQDPEHDPLSVVQYGNIHLYRYTSRPLAGSVIIIDDRLVCTLTADLVQEQLTQTAAFAQCSDGSADIGAALHRAAPLITRSRPYLEE